MKRLLDGVKGVLGDDQNTFIAHDGHVPIIKARSSGRNVHARVLQISPSILLGDHDENMVLSWASESEDADDVCRSIASEIMASRNLEESFASSGVEVNY